jgi:hypothetical protein
MERERMALAAENTVCGVPLMSCQAPATRNSFTQAVQHAFPDLLSCSIFILFFSEKTNGKSMAGKYSKRKTIEQYKTKRPNNKLKHIQILAEEAQ